MDGALVATPLYGLRIIMDLAFIITLLGTILTAIGTGITIYQVSRVRKYKEEIHRDVLKVNTFEAIDILKIIQSESRKILFVSQNKFRGAHVDEILQSIQKNIDDVLLLLDPDNNTDIVNKINDAQKKLISFRSAQNNDQKLELISDFYYSIQNIISSAQKYSKKLSEA